MSVRLDVVHSGALGREARAAIVQLCVRAYGEDFSRLFDDFEDTVHVCARDDGGPVVSHAMWVRRWLQAVMALP